MSSGRFLPSVCKAGAVALALGFFLIFCNRDLAAANATLKSGNIRKVAPQSKDHSSKASRRDLFLSSRLGLQFGVPKQAIPRAIAKMRAMERVRPEATSAAVSSGIGNASAPATTVTGGVWQSLGPLPMAEKANFTGLAIGSNTAMTGRLTAVAADSTGLIVVGAASGGLWVSTNNGASFTSVFDSQPTQAIGAVALDTTTTPSTIYVGTGEGNGSIDSLYGDGLYKSS